MPVQSDILVAWPAEHILVFRPAEERGLKLSLATTTAKASERVIADPLGFSASEPEKLPLTRVYGGVDDVGSRANRSR